MPYPRTAFLERFWAKVDRRGPTDCWLWQGSRCGGYGHLRVGGRSRRKVYAHRVAYKLHRGGISSGLEIDHLCRTPSCVNPAHMELVTKRENGRRSRHAQLEEGACLLL